MPEIPIFINPATYSPLPQRREASEAATERGHGLRMVLRSASTSFYADPSIPVGDIHVWAPPSYGAPPLYVTTLRSWDEPWEPGPALIENDGDWQLDDGSGWCGVTREDRRVSWAEQVESLNAKLRHLDDVARFLADLDRSPHGRHQGDVEAQTSSGVSQGNPHLPTGQVIGYDIAGRPYQVPEPHLRGNVEAWRSRKPLFAADAERPETVPLEPLAPCAFTYRDDEGYPWRCDLPAGHPPMPDSMREMPDEKFAARRERLLAAHRLVADR